MQNIIVLATHNKDKLREIKKLLKDLPIKVVSLDNFKNVPEVIEDGKTLEANAKKKAREVSLFLKRMAVSDDSGLHVDALGGDPGVYSARFSGKNATYKSNNEKVLTLLKDMPRDKRKAKFMCVIALADNGKVIDTVEGNIRGHIAYKEKGRKGFGYDPIFIPNGYKKTFAEISLREKNKISHRSRALVKAKKLIEKYIAAFVIPLLFLINFAGSFNHNKDVIDIRIKGNVYKFKFADTKEKRAKGLMHIKDLDKDSGMFFVLDKKSNIGFYMKDTYIPLDIAFIDENFKIMEIKELKPLDPTLVYPSKIPTYALETNKGFFERVGIGVRDRVDIFSGHK